MEFTGERLVPTAEGHDALFLEHVSRYIFASSLVGGKRVLDSGCGCGYGSYHLARSGARSVLGLDLSAEAIAYCKENFRHSGLVYDVGDLLASGLQASSFDVITSFEVFEHLREPERYLAEMRRLLVPEGVFVVSTPNARTYREGEAESNEFHVREYLPEEFEAYLRAQFKSIVFYTQSPAVGIGIVPLQDGNGSRSVPMELQLVPNPSTSIWGQPAPTRVSWDECAYVVAVCQAEEARLQTAPGAHLFCAGEDLGVSSDHIVRQLQKELDSRTRWVQSIKRELDLRDQTIRTLQREFEERTKWALELRDQVERQAREIAALKKILSQAGVSGGLS